MSAVAAMAALAVLLACAALREVAAARSERRRPQGPGSGALGLSGFGLRGRAAVAALRLGLPGRLARSGLDLPLAAVLLAKCAGAAAGGIAAWLAAPGAPGHMSLLVAVGLPAAGFVVPDALLEREARRRHRRVLAALPDALDLLAVSSASGGSPAAGLAEIARTGAGPLCEEMRVAMAEVSCGKPLADALGDLRARVPGVEVATLCAAIERSRRFGSPLGEQLRRQSSALRRDQRRGVEERAARAAPKIQLVVALVLVPSVLLMISAALIANAETLIAGF